MSKGFLNWSSGKDALMALLEIEASGTLSIQKLVTTYTSGEDLVSMHRLHLNFLEEQAKSLQLPLEKIPHGRTASMQQYDSIINQSHLKLIDEGFTHGVFGDIFLEDLKAYRQSQFDPVNLEPVFPLWKKDTALLAKNFIEKGYKAVVICTDDQKLPVNFCGRQFDRVFLNDLPAEVDPCGENGEFHTFVYDGPRFSRPVAFKKGSLVKRDFSSSSDDDDSSPRQEKNWSQSFHYQELLLP